MDLRGKVAIVTGGAGGIGRATVERMRALGARVASVDRKGADLTCDVTDEAQVARAVDDTVARHGRLDVVVNNAGLMVFKPLEEHTRDDWMKVLSVDLLGAFWFIREAFRRMDGGAIVNVSSVHAIETTPLVAAYAAAKAALVSLTHTAAIEGKAKGIRVNAVLPGAVDTPMLWENPNVKSGLEQIRAADVGKPEDVAEVIAFLASPAAAFVNGAAVLVDGGRISRL